MATLVDAPTTLPDAVATLPDAPTTLPEAGTQAADLTPGALLVARVPVDETAEGCGPDELSDQHLGGPAGRLTGAQDCKGIRDRSAEDVQDHGLKFGVDETGVRRERWCR